MARTLTWIDRHWDWRISARLRVAWLVLAWLLVALAGPLGWLVAPLAVVRSALSFVQAALNIRLGRRVPVARQDRLDWLLIAGIFAGAYVVAGVQYSTGAGYSPWLLAPLLAPFSVLQVRMVRRSWEAQRRIEARPAVIHQLERYQREGPRTAGRRAA